MKVQPATGQAATRPQKPDTAERPVTTRHGRAARGMPTAAAARSSAMLKKKPLPSLPCDCTVSTDHSAASSE